MKKSKTDKIKADMLQAFDEIQMPRTPYVLENMVVNSRFTEEQQYAQCVLELSIAYDNLRLAKINVERKERKLAKIKGSTRDAQLDREEIEIEMEQTRRAMLGAEREFEYLFKKWQSYKKKYTREDLNKAQETEYRIRLETQAQQDLNATGKISQSNQEGLRQIGIELTPQLPVGEAVQRRYLEQGNVKIFRAMCTEKIPGKDYKNPFEGIQIPAGVQISEDIYCCVGKPIADAYNDIVQHALTYPAGKPDFLFILEDDTYPKPDVLQRLYALMSNERNKRQSHLEKLPIVGGWYPKRQKFREGAHIEVIGGVRTFMPDDGTVREAYTICQGCILIPMTVFLDIPFPWFMTTRDLSQDSFFSQLAREAGYKLLVDTSIKCKHIDRVTKKVYQ
jgi:hypothetical protein